MPRTAKEYYQDELSRHLDAMEGWLQGQRSHANLYHESPALVAALDAAEVQKHAAAAMCYGWLAALEAS